MTQKQALLLAIFLVTYGLLFYFLIAMQLRLDFASFYSATLAYIEGSNPYKVLVANYFPTPMKLPPNLNPPFFLNLIQPFTKINYPLAAIIWSLLSFVAGLAGSGIVFIITFPGNYLAKNWLTLLFVYLALYSTLMNTTIAQLGAILLFFIMSGYYFYLQKRDNLAGILWGIIAAIKLFPALLFFLALTQKRYKVLFAMSLTGILTWLIPLYTYGKSIYSIYFDMLPRVFWYGDNWNASIYGFLFRLFVDPANLFQNLFVVKTVYLILFFLSLVWYLQTISRDKNKTSDHRAFCLTLVMMLLMSPFGWMYYFSLLIMPMIITWQSIIAEKSPINTWARLWIFCLFLLDFPIGYVTATHMQTMFYKLSIFSCYFYGLLLLAYLLSRTPSTISQQEASFGEKSSHLSQPIMFILTFGLSVPLAAFLVRLMKMSFLGII